MATRYPSVPGVEFRDIDGFPGYCVGVDGSVWSRKNTCPPFGLGENWHRLSPGRIGRRSRVESLMVGLSDRGRRGQFRVHRLVLEAFVGPCPEGHEGCHNDGNPLNNRLSNLRWDTPSANNRDKERHGTHQIGSRNGRSKLTEADAADIRRRCADGQQKADVARDYGVSATLVRFIVGRRNWRHVV